MNLGKETGGMGKRWRENRFESVPKENKEGCAEKGDRIEVENTVAKGEFTERNVKANRHLLLEVGQKKECGEQTSCQWRSQTPAFSSWLSFHSPHHLYLIPDNSAACPSASPYSNSRVGQSTEPCNREVFAVT